MTTAKKWSLVIIAVDDKHFADTITPLGGKWKPASVPSDFRAMTNEALPPVLLPGPVVSTEAGSLGPRMATWVTDCKGLEKPHEGLQLWTASRWGVCVQSSAFALERAPAPDTQHSAAWQGPHPPWPTCPAFLAARSHKRFMYPLPSDIKSLLCWWVDCSPNSWMAIYFSVWCDVDIRYAGASEDDVCLMTVNSFRKPTHRLLDIQNQLFGLLVWGVHFSCGIVSGLTSFWDWLSQDNRKPLPPKMGQLPLLHLQFH